MDKVIPENDSMVAAGVSSSTVYDKAKAALDGLCDGSHRFRMSIPVKQDDTDVLIANALTLAKALAEKVQASHTDENPRMREKYHREARLVADALLVPNWKIEPFQGWGRIKGDSFRVAGLAVTPPREILP